jgi:transposase
MEQRQTSTKIAGIDVGKSKLDGAVHGLEDTTQIDNAPAGFSELIGWLKAREVGRVGLEATGGYERAVRQALEAAGFEVVVHQPIEVRRFAQMKRWRAKTDRLDAQLIAAATAQVDAVRAAQDPRLQALAERLTTYEQITDQAAQLKTFLEHVTLADLTKAVRAQIRAMTALKAKLAAEILKQIKAHDDLLARYRLLVSLPGFGPIVAATHVIRMPELGRMRRGQPASLIGVAPFARDSGQHKGQRFIGGGRDRPRRMLYIAALAAKRWDPTLRAFAEQLSARGKPPKLVIVAVMRKLVEAANLILSRGQPWLRQPPA